MLLLLVPTLGHCFNLFDIGLVNGQKARLDLTIEYSNGRRIDISLKAGKSLLMTRGIGEHITKITVSGRGGSAATYDVARLRQRAETTRRKGEWLYFDGSGTRVISSAEKHALEHHSGLTNR